MANKIVQFTDADGNNIYPMGYAQGGVKRELVWSNPNPTATFNAQVVNIDLSQYDMVLINITFYDSGATVYNNSLQMFEKGGKGTLTSGNLNQIYDTRVFKRAINSITNSGIDFGVGLGSAGTDNGVCIPYKIYGLKMSYLVPTEVHGLTYTDDDTNGNITLRNNDGTKALYPKGQATTLDVTRVIASASVATYTATEDCYVVATSLQSYRSTYVNGVYLGDFLSNYGMLIYPLKKGDTINFKYNGSDNPPNQGIKVFGVKH